VSSFVTAREMAREAKVNVKTFRHVLRVTRFPWHKRYQRWKVRRGSPEHRDMQRVLSHLKS
jgi:hypothetical protein